MATLERNGYPATLVESVLHGRYGPRTWSFRYDLLDKEGAYKQALSNVLRDSAAVEFNALQPIMRTGSFELVEDENTPVDWGNDLIRPWACLRMPDGGKAEFPMGTLVLSTAPLKVSAGGARTRTVQTYDLAVRLDSPCGERYTVYAGDNVIAKVQSILESQGLTRHNLTGSTRSTPATREWEPSTTWLEIVNELLAMIGYNRLWFDEMGVAQAAPYVSPDQRAPNYTYAANALSVLHPEAERGHDWFRVANRWVRYTSDTDTGSLRSVYTNTNPASPTSTTSRGYTITNVEQVEAVDQSTLDEITRRAAWEESQVYELAQFATALMPFHGFEDVLRLDYPDLGPAANYVEVHWAVQLKAGAPMKHVARRIVPV